ncbi:MAG: hypothetical protein M4D80_32080 [Myxococcota bacterium]|nr:hypothetical protein [Myxococcota bacterium]
MPCGAQLEVTALAQREGDVEVSDHADLEIRVLPILPRERIDEIIRQHLLEQGWTKGDDGTLTKQIGDVQATLPPGSSTIRVTLSDEKRIAVEAKAKARIDPGDEEGQAKVDQAASKKAEQKLADAQDRARREMEEQIANQLLGVWRELRAELDEVVNVTTRQALEERASQLGSIESIEEGRDKDRGYELTITVRT